ncbi:hypothetical protein SLH49_10955 [Cognatiyoonia sp. IB215446]|uniref:hypothetical protein n=1 Tax=Cognatiyoonia sp. IB215446 TaxID=3097355 RepID=UPI002A0F5A90|nr:hypothetical protein [Cognatiyoonia sp. IB215446]MDX8348506.1 hypothetical protein [Cognatiyoonia sp. IB215446]
MLSYEFDIYCAGGAHIPNSSGSGRGLTLDGQRRTDAIIALFKDQETADAVTASPPVVRLFLEETGFGFGTADNVAQSGYVPVTDDARRQDLVSQLTQTLSNRALKKALSRVARHSAFDVVAFIASVMAPGDDNQVGDDHIIPTAKVTPRRPGELRCKGIKSRMRPH